MDGYYGFVYIWCKIFPITSIFSLWDHWHVHVWPWRRELNWEAIKRVCGYLYWGRGGGGSGSGGGVANFELCFCIFYFYRIRHRCQICSIKTTPIALFVLQTSVCRFPNQGDRISKSGFPTQINSPNHGLFPPSRRVPAVSLCKYVYKCVHRQHWNCHKKKIIKQKKCFFCLSAWVVLNVNFPWITKRIVCCGVCI